MKNFLKEKIINNKKTFGTWLTLSNANFAEIYSKYFDFLIIDKEHGVYSNNILDLIRACEINSCSPIVRVPKNSPEYILSALDSGAHGILTPMVQNENDLKKIINSVYYSPIGMRGYSGFTRTFKYNQINSNINNQDINKKILNIILIESEEGLKNLDFFLNSKFVDIVYFGYYDLSQSLKLDLKKDWSKINNLISKAIKFARRRKKGAGIMALNKYQIKMFSNYGANFIPYQVDCSILDNTLNELKKTFNKFS